MSTQDDDFLGALLAAFQAEAAEHVQAVSSGLLELENVAEAAPPALIESIYRETHSLKGASRAVNMTGIETICQALESAFSAWKGQERIPASDDLDLFHQALDVVSQILAAPDEADEAQAATVAEAITRYMDDSREEQGTATESAASVPGTPRAGTSAGPPKGGSVPAGKPFVPDTVRTASAKLDALVVQAEEMLTAKLFAAQRVAELRDAASVLEQWQREWAKVRPGVRALREAVAKGQDDVEPGVSALLDFLDWNLDCVRGLESDVIAMGNAAEQHKHAIDRMVDDLLTGSKTLLMMPFSSLLDILPKLVRDLSREQGKDVRLIVRGSDVEIDKRILGEMKDPLIHLVRNCIDHGIEKPEERTRAGKSSAATLTVAVSQVEGNKAEILVSDDGAGINREEVIAAAIRRGVTTEQEAQSLSDAEALALIFLSNVSTSPLITELSGRGLGLAIVWEKATKLGGEVTAHTEFGQGTTFRTVLPLTLATFRGVLVQAVGESFVIPTVSVQRVGRVRQEDIRTVENREVMTFDGVVVSLVRLHEVLARPAPLEPESVPWWPVLLLSAGELRIAFLVDQILNEEEVLITRLGRPLERVPNIAGATILGSGKVVPVLNVLDLLKTAANLQRAPTDFSPGKGSAEAPRKSVLVVEDSITSRMLLRSVLESGGYTVQIAVDGVDALRLLNTERVDLVVSDVQMPRMDGIALTAAIRTSRELAELPVVLVTALGSDEDRERGIDVGANAYIVKSSFDQSNLLDTVQRLL